MTLYESVVYESLERCVDEKISTDSFIDILESMEETYTEGSELDEVFEEGSIIKDIGNVMRKHDDEKEIRRILDKQNGNSSYKFYISTKVTDEDFRTIRSYFQKLKDTKTYADYKKAFDGLCKFCFISPQNCVIDRHFLHKGKEDKNTVVIIYVNTRKEIILPAGTILYHRSPLSNLDKTGLQPQFRGRGGYSHFYCSPRIYLSTKIVPSVVADQKASDTSHMYVVTENITRAFVDPMAAKLFGASNTGAVYVESKYPLKCKKLSDISKDAQKEVDKKDKQATALKNGAKIAAAVGAGAVAGVAIANATKGKSSVKKEYVEVDADPVFDNLFDFMEYYGLEFADEEGEEYTESISQKIGELQRQKSGKELMKKFWHDASSSIKKTYVSKFLNKKEVNELHSINEKIKKTEKYSDYKKLFDRICRMFGIQSKGTVIKKIKISIDECSLDYSSGNRKRITVPNGYCLIHKTNRSNLTELKPAFRSSDTGGLLYDTPRVYFSLVKDTFTDKLMNKFDRKKNYGSHSYIPKDVIRTAFIDPSAPSFSAGSLFVETGFPIPCKEINL